MIDMDSSHRLIDEVRQGSVLIPDSALGGGHERVERDFTRGRLVGADVDVLLITQENLSKVVTISQVGCQVEEA